MGLRNFVERLFGREKELTQSATSAQVLQVQDNAQVTIPEVHPTKNQIIDYMARPVLQSKPTGSDYGDYPRFWGNYTELDKFADSSDICGIVFSARKNELFRKGIAIKDQQGKEATGLPVTTEAPKSILEEQWSNAQDDLLESFIQQSNANGQQMVQILKQLEEDECRFDDAYLMCQFVYEVNDEGLIVSKRAKEFMRMDPKFMRIICDRRNRLGRTADGEKVWFSITDRNKPILEPAAKKMKYKDKNGVQLLPAHFRFDSSNTGAGGSSSTFYAPWEVCHASEWNSTATYSSMPPLLQIWMKVWTLVKMDEYVMKNYALQRPPKFFLVFNTSNSTSLEKEYNKMIQRAQMDPHIPQILANENKETGGGVQVIDLMRPLEEMQFVEVRLEYRQQVGARYGVMPIWHADLSTSGGLNNEGMQITVTNRAIEDGQTFYNTTFLHFISRSIGVPDKILVLNPSEELDEVAQLTLQRMKIDNASAARALGLTVEFDNKTGEFKFSGIVSPAPPPMPMGFGGDGGFGEKPAEAPGGLKQPQPSGTSQEEVMQSDFRYPGQAGDLSQAEPGKKSTEQLGIVLSGKLLREFEPVLKELERMAKKDPAKARREVQRIARLLSGRIRELTETELRRVYVNGQKGVEQEYNLAPMFTGRDESTIRLLLQNPVYIESVKDLRSTIEKAAYRTIVDSVAEEGSFNLKTVRAAIEAIVDESEPVVNTLARTHTNRFFQAGRRSGYKRAEEEAGEQFKYDWIGPNDHRTTPCCKRIKAAIESRGGAVDWDELYRIVSRESRKDYPDFPVEKDAPTAHWNCRHLAMRVA